MTVRGLLRRLALSERDLESIRAAVRAAEEKTSGEIALAAIGESSDYSFRELLAAIALGAAAFLSLLPLHGAITAFLDRVFWHLPAWYVTAFYGTVLLAVTGIAFAFANIPAIDRLIVPKRERSRAVYARALRQFAESGAYATREGTGILVFVSLLEREVRIVADTGISAKVDQSEWDRLARDLAIGIKDGKAADAFVKAVVSCGEILARHFPPRKDDPNELPDGLVILGGDR